MKTKPRLVILNPTCLEVLDAHTACLDATGLDWVASRDFMLLTPARADAAMRDADALILPASIRNLPSAEQMAAHPRLKVISIAASGYDWLDVDAATRCGIVVTMAPAREGVEVVADLALGFMLALARQIPWFDRRVAAGQHGRGMGVSVWGKTLGIVGLGRIGQAVARRADGFDMRVLAAEPHPDEAFVRRHGIEVVEIETLLRESDFVSLHVRLDGTTCGMIGAAQLERMKPSAFLINTARQELIDESALVRAIESRRIAGAALDDPPTAVTQPLAGLPNVIFAPHHGNRAIEGVHAVFRLAIDNAVHVLAGRRPEHLVNAEIYSSGALRLRAGSEVPQV